MTPSAFYEWKEKFLVVGRFALAGPSKNGAVGAELAVEVQSLKKLIGELTIANSALKEALMEDEKQR